MPIHRSLLPAVAAVLSLTAFLAAQGARAQLVPRLVTVAVAAPQAACVPAAKTPYATRTTQVRRGAANVTTQQVYGTPDCSAQSLLYTISGTTVVPTQLGVELL